MNLPIFPNYANVCDLNESQINLNSDNLRPYSDFVFSNIWSWNLDKSFKISQLNGNIILFLRDHRSKEFFLSIKGLNMINETFEIVLNELDKFGVPEALNLIPEETATKLDPAKFEITEDRDSFDYVYSIDNLIELSGKSFKTKRQLCNFFENNNKNVEISIESISDETKKQILRFISEENSRRTKLGYTPFAEYEMAALENFMTLPEDKNILAFILRVDGEIVGCSMDQLLPNDFALSHFFKASIAYKGSYDYLNRKIAIYLKDLGVQYWNWVEDSGLEGLRQAKLSYKPEYLLKKYTVIRR